MPGPITIRVTTPVIKYMLFLIENANFIVCTVVKLSVSSIIVHSCSWVSGRLQERSVYSNSVIGSGVTLQVT